MAVQAGEETLGAVLVVGEESGHQGAVGLEVLLALLTFQLVFEVFLLGVVFVLFIVLGFLLLGKVGAILVEIVPPH